ncbi:MAG: hypothetical protein DMF86_15995 [Acidobacteria bacterium]|nr:MAG: hypothetical protein DMF86_15995 [Acidobacteriota bacterium]
MRLRRASIILILAAVPTFVMPRPILAQGHGNAHGQSNAGGPSGIGAEPAGVDVRNFGSWLDDASIAPPGNGTVNVSFGYYRTPLFHEIDMPVVDGGVGLTKKVQFGFSVPFFHVSQGGAAPAAHGLGDLYMNAKVQLRDPATHADGVGFAVIPVVEILNNASIDRRRVNWALPASVEVQRRAWRAYASGGYFSRGSLFASGAVELTVSERAWMTCSGGSSYSTKIDPVGESLGLSRSRTDVSVGISYAAAPAIAVFGSMGRTLSRQDANAGTVIISGGASFGFSAWRPSRPPRRK